MGVLKMYSNSASFHDWGSGVLEMNQITFTENRVAQYGISATSNIPRSPGVDLDPRKDGEPGIDEEVPGTDPWLRG